MSEMIWVYLIIYGIAFGILSSLAVKNKNRDQSGWFIIGFLFGVFGLVAAVLVDKIDDSDNISQKSEDFEPNKITKKCPDCAESIKLEANVCRFCQYRFSEEEVAKQIELEKEKHKLEVTKSSSSSQWQCRNCFRFNPFNLSSCDFCKAKKPDDFIIPCPNCENKESISGRDLFDQIRYKAFSVKVGSSSENWKLTCLKCKYVMKYNPHEYYESKE